MKDSRPGLGFRRSERLKESRDFFRLKREGGRLARGTLVLNWGERGVAGSRLGVVASKKTGGAVVRNRAKRLMREAFRLHRHELKRPVDLVLVARGSIVGRPFKDVERDFLSLLVQAGLRERPAIS